MHLGESLTERCFAILDEGCNSTCHTTAWATKMKHVLEQFGPKIAEQMGDVVGPGKNYTGIGKVKSLGKRVIPT